MINENGALISCCVFWSHQIPLCIFVEPFFVCICDPSSNASKMRCTGSIVHFSHVVKFNYPLYNSHTISSSNLAEANDLNPSIMLPVANSVLFLSWVDNIQGFKVDNIQGYRRFLLIWIAELC